MSDKLSREEVLHVARLARIELTEEEIEKYQVQLQTLFNEVEKIKDVELKNDDKLIAWVEHTTELREDVEGVMLDPEEIMKNVPVSNGNFVEVPVMINE